MRITDLFMRNARSVVITGRSRVLLVGEDGPALEHRTAYPQAWSSLMQQLSEPLPGSAARELAAAIPDLDERLWRQLLEAGHVLQASDAGTLHEARERLFRHNPGYHFAPAAPLCEHLVIGCTGSVVAGLMAPTILSLAHSGFQRRLDVILSETAQRFLTRDLLAAYAIRTWTDAFERQGDLHVPHVQLGRGADLVLVMPATANALYRLANATCTDLLSLTVTATTAPIVVVPAMNETMWNNPAVQRNVQRLREDGRYVIEPTVIFGAADLAAHGAAMYGGHGTMWAGPGTLMRSLEAVLKGARAGDPRRAGGHGGARRAPVETPVH